MTVGHGDDPTVADAPTRNDTLVGSDRPPGSAPRTGQDAEGEPDGSTRRRRIGELVGIGAVLLVAAALRFWNLGHPQLLVFDESFYVKDAWTLLQNGYESSWGDDPDAAFAQGDADGFSDAPLFAVHPPLGKWLIGLGMAAFGPEQAIWWRASTALAGTAAVLVLMLVARHLFASTALTVIAGGLFAIDGNAVVMSRVAILDTWLMLFALLGFWFILLDRRRSRRLLAITVETGRTSSGGPVIWARPWLVAAGVAFGAAAAVKWSGLWFLAAFGIYAVVTDALARRSLSIEGWVKGAFKQAPVTFLLLVPIAAITYLASWTGWLVTDGGWNRHAGGDPSVAGPVGWLLEAARSLWIHHQAIYAFHLGVETTHPWQANPLTWLLMITPTNMLYREVPDGCGAETCTETIIGMGNPFIWWAAAAATIYLVYRMFRYREWQVAAILTGVAAGYLPWLLYLDRTVYQFYSIAFQPFTILALTCALGHVLGTGRASAERRPLRYALVGVFLFWVVVASAYLAPLWVAAPLTPEHRNALLVLLWTRM